jgi:hypothetical protein
MSPKSGRTLDRGELAYNLDEGRLGCGQPAIPDTSRLLEPAGHFMI